MGIIYKATNKANGKSYIGQTSRDLEFYITEHIRKANLPYNQHRAFHAAIVKYGAQSFVWETLEECPQSELDEREQHYIQKYRTYVGFKDCNGYNMTLGGKVTSHQYQPLLFATSGFTGKTHSSANKEKFSDAMKRKWSDAAWREARINHTRRRKRNAAPMVIISPDGKSEHLSVGLQKFCDTHNLPFTTMRRWVNKGKIRFKRPPRLEITKSAEGWEIKSEARYYS